MATLSAAAAPSDPARVTIASGPIEGSAEGATIAFRGIPYAAAPVADLRWRAPQPVKPWAAVRDAKQFAPVCMQQIIPMDEPQLTSPSEDCLFLNVWKPAVASAKARPVVVWIHGGGLMNGGSASRIFDGATFAKDGFVTVTLNYRLGRFGFFAHPALTAAKEGPTGNFGFMDQIAALKWVQANIAKFGGDPKQVMVVGESAGGISILTLMGSPAAKGLFARAVVMSGGGRSLLAPKALPEAERFGENFARSAGITASGPAALAQLRALPAAMVSEGVFMAIGKVPGGDTYVGGGMIDGTVITGATEAIFRAGKQAKVPLIVGATSDDAPIGARPGDKDALFAAFGAEQAAARAAYDPDGSLDVDLVRRAMARDRAFLEPSRFIATSVARTGQPVWFYRFSYVAQSLLPSPGARHASDVPYMFGTVAARYGDKLAPRDTQLSNSFHAYVENFARTGNPNGDGQPAWAPFHAGDKTLLDLAADGQARMVRDPFAARLDATERLTETK
ncbi:carboxylesterase family protein [Sphingomonas sp. HITSZ_GF]|uniref:carboxylesterase/lipase family protein n=1 Tax=Sphingomonas sp. HITSZ_GF TaxID=3037247 RepID=UPI00240D39D1|nr:carboxylesterase family protein [Sphingomonas sp. HITSZ_GF]MDG2533460.1 carboxylesterase family protein [Sphingomonas sp. HITSZ_GF]